MKQAELVQRVIEAAVEVHEALGPGLTNETYAACLCREMFERSIGCQRNVAYPVIYKNYRTGETVTIDILIEDAIVVQVVQDQELCRENSPTMIAQLRHSGKEAGVLLNFAPAGGVTGLRHIVLQQ